LVKPSSSRFCPITKSSSVSNRQGDYKADLADAGSVRNVLKAIGKVDGIISAAGAARFAPLEKLSDEDFNFSNEYKSIGRICFFT